MDVKIEELMVAKVMVATPHQTVSHVRSVMREHKINAMPVVNPEKEPIGIVSTTDLMEDHSDNTPISNIMTKKVYTVPMYDAPRIAARIMRNHDIHHVIVTDGKKIAGMISSFDLLRLVEDHRFTMKNTPTPSKGSKSGRTRNEAGE